MIKTRHDYPDELGRVLSAIQDSTEGAQEVEIDFDGEPSVLALACRTIQGVGDVDPTEWGVTGHLEDGVEFRLKIVEW